MNTTKNIILAATLSLLSVSHIGAAQAETLKPLQGASFHAGSKDAVAYFLSENRTCKFVLTTADKDAQPTRFEAALLSGESSSYEFQILIDVIFSTNLSSPGVGVFIPAGRNTAIPRKSVFVVAADHKA